MNFLFKALWFIIKLPFEALADIIWDIRFSFSDKRKERKLNQKLFKERYLKTFSSISSKEVNRYTPLKIDIGSIKKISIDNSEVDIEKSLINDKGVITFHCEKEWYKAKYDIFLYQEGVVIKYNRKYYFRAFDYDNICCLNKVYEEVSWILENSLSPIERLKQISENDYRYRITRYYTKKGELDKRYLDKYKWHFYVWTGVCTVYIKCGYVEISLIPTDLNSVYKILKDNFYQTNKEIPSLEDTLPEPSWCDALLTSDDRSLINEFLLSDGDKEDAAIAQEIYTEIIRRCLKRYVGTM